MCPTMGCMGLRSRLTRRLLASLLEPARLLSCDVDGVLTDGGRIFRLQWSSFTASRTRLNVLHTPSLEFFFGILREPPS